MKDFRKPGPYEVAKGSYRIRHGKVRAWVAKDVSSKSMVVFNNGTGAPSRYYQGLLNHLASYGINVLCPESTRTGSGAFAEEAVRHYLSDYPDTKVGCSGHSQGGSASVATYSRLGGKADSLFPIFPAWGMGRWTIKEDIASVKCPTFIVQGGKDSSVPAWWLNIGLNYFQTEVYHGLAHKADHIFNWQPIVAPVMVAWFLWTLKKDPEGKAYIDSLNDSPQDWDVSVLGKGKSSLSMWDDEVPILEGIDMTEVELVGE